MTAQYDQRASVAASFVLGGPYKDNCGGLVAIEATSPETAREILDGDPAIAAGVMLGDVHPWLILAGTATTPNAVG